MVRLNSTFGPTLQNPLPYFSLLLVVLSTFTSPIFASERRFSVPEDLALRIRLDDTLTRGRHRIHCGRCRGPGNYGFQGTPEDHAERRAGDADSHDGALRSAGKATAAAT
jgi:hypothetical protein